MFNVEGIIFQVPLKSIAPKTAPGLAQWTLCKFAFLKHLRVPMAVLFGFLLIACGGGGGGGGGGSGGTAPASLTSVALPKTGQTTCYDAAGATIPCTGTGQDGDLKAGVAWPNPRFVVGTGAGVDCVTDNLTGLMWVKAPSTTPAIWSAALTSANDLTLCGFSDWRLPNINELESLVNSEVTFPTTFLSTQGFSGVQASNYWSSSNYAVSANYAWIVGMDGGDVGFGVKYNNYYVWPVRAGQ